MGTKVLVIDEKVVLKILKKYKDTLLDLESENHSDYRVPMEKLLVMLKKWPQPTAHALCEINKEIKLSRLFYEHKKNLEELYERMVRNDKTSSFEDVFTLFESCLIEINEDRTRVLWKKLQPLFISDGSGTKKTLDRLSQTYTVIYERQSAFKKVKMEKQVMLMQEFLDFIQELTLGQAHDYNRRKRVFHAIPKKSPLSVALSKRSTEP